MIPSVSQVLSGDIEFTEPPSRTFFFDIDENLVYGQTDNREAMKQAIYLILSIERYKYAILPQSYGIELSDLFGMPISWVIPEVKRRITEALLQDSRITAVDNFTFQTGKRTLLVMFTAHTGFGEVAASKEVGF